MQRKIIGFIIMIIGFFSICGVLYYLFINGLFPNWMNFWEKDVVHPDTSVSQPKKEEPSDRVPLINDRQVKKIISFEDQDIPQEEEKKEEVVKKEFGKEDLGRIASSFAERFGSYSNQSNFSNVKDLEIYMTDKMKTWSDDFVLKQRNVASDSEDYFGVTTKAINFEILEYDEEMGNAKMRIMCRRRESRNTITNSGEVYSQDIVIVMKKEYDAWKVDAAFWEEL